MGVVLRQGSSRHSSDVPACRRCGILPGSRVRCFGFWFVSLQLPAAMQVAALSSAKPKPFVAGPQGAARPSRRVPVRCSATQGDDQPATSRR